MANHIAPSYLTVGNVNSVNRFFNEFFEDPDARLNINCEGIRWVDPVGLCVLRQYLSMVDPLTQEIRLDRLSDNLASYLERMRFFDELPGVACANRPRGNRRNDLADSLVELRRVDGPMDADSTAGAIARAIVGTSRASNDPDPEGMRASPAERLHHNLQYVFSELINNAAFHGRARGFPTAEIWVAAQYYATNNLVHICICDSGCGFLNSLRGHSALQEESDAAAIMAALRPRVSCNRDLARGLDSGNQGIGLTASQAIAQRANGNTSIFSGNAWYRGARGSASIARMVRSWQGVTVSLKMDRDLLQDLDIAAIINEVAPNREARDFDFE